MRRLARPLVVIAGRSAAGTRRRERMVREATRMPAPQELFRLKQPPDIDRHEHEVQGEHGPETGGEPVGDEGSVGRQCRVAQSEQVVARERKQGQRSGRPAEDFLKWHTQLHGVILFCGDKAQPQQARCEPALREMPTRSTAAMRRAQPRTRRVRAWRG